MSPAFAEDGEGSKLINNLLVYPKRAQSVAPPQSYGKIASAPETQRNFWRDDRAAEGACLENMFGESQRGFESHSLR
jgi:hypothetical protein